jgi:hypothetical protein
LRHHGFGVLFWCHFRSCIKPRPIGSCDGPWSIRVPSTQKAKLINLRRYPGPRPPDSAEYSELAADSP